MLIAGRLGLEPFDTLAPLDRFTIFSKSISTRLVRNKK